MTIEGHCDERGSAEYNLALGERRAVAARAYLVSVGISADRLRTVSYGKEFPFDAGPRRGGVREKPPRALRRDREVSDSAMKLRTITTALVAAALVAAVRVPASAAADKETRQMMADIRMLQEQAAADSEPPRGADRCAESDRREASTRASTSRPTPTRKSFADEQTIVDEHPRTTSRTVREKLDDNNDAPRPARRRRCRRCGN